MNLEELKEISISLKKFREDRCLTFEKQAKGYIKNINEEFGEFLVATKNKDKYEVIDALCDLTVFTLNQIESIEDDKLEYILSGYKGRNEYLKLLHPSNASMEEKIKYIEGYIQRSIFKFLDVVADSEILNKIKSDDYSIFISSYYMGIGSWLAAIEYLGYDSYKAMTETLKEIHSRTGSYDETIGKWVKDTSEEAKSKWYKANYDNALKG